MTPARRSVLDAFAAASRANGAPRRRSTADAVVDMEMFLEQPYHVPELDDLEEELDFVLDDVLKTRVLPALPRPVLINVIRSPGYVPVKYLALLECRTLDTLADVYGLDTVHHEPRVDPRRTNCDRAFRYATVGGS